MALTYALIEDEPPARQRLKRLVQEVEERRKSYTRRMAAAICSEAGLVMCSPSALVP